MIYVPSYPVTSLPYWTYKLPIGTSFTENEVPAQPQHSTARSSSWEGLNCALFFVPMVSPEPSDAAFSSAAFLILLVLAREEWVREKSLVLHSSLAVTPSSGNPETIPALSVPWPSSKCFSLKIELRPCLSQAGALHTLSCRLCSQNRNTSSLWAP